MSRRSHQTRQKEGPGVGPFRRELAVVLALFERSRQQGKRCLLHFRGEVRNHVRFPERKSPACESESEDSPPRAPHVWPAWRLFIFFKHVLLFCCFLF